MKNSSLITWIIGGLIIAAALVAYFTYFSGQTTESDTTLNSVPEEELVAQQVLTLLNQIKSLHIDTSMFESSAYKSLVDFTVEIPDQKVGRPNPFAPVPGMPAPSSQTLQNLQQR